MNDSLDKSKPFGINLVNSSKMSEIGCTAEVTDVLKRYNDGKMDIVVMGKERYKLNTFTDGATPYYLAEVNYFDDENFDINQRLLHDTVELFNEISKHIKSVEISPIKMLDLNTKYPSFFIAQKSGLMPYQKQDLLELLDENKRLEYLGEHLRKLLPVIKDAESLEKIIKYDGYLKPNFFKS